MCIRTFAIEDEARIIEIWHACNLVIPRNDPHRDILKKMEFQPGLFLVAESEDELVGSVMAGYDGHRGWINYRAVHPDHQGKGIGRRLMEAAESCLKDLGCQKINLQVRVTNKKVLSFYQRIGFKEEYLFNMGKKLDRP
jgi:ribosomal protein S18 acetylase RimI-like enzyme